MFFLHRFYLYYMLDVTYLNTCWFCLANPMSSCYRLSLATLGSPKIIVIAKKLLFVPSKHSHLVIGFRTTSHILRRVAFETLSFSICIVVTMMDVEVIVSIEMGEGISMVILANNFLIPPSRISWLLFNTFLLTCPSICFNCSIIYFLCKYALNPPSRFDLQVLISFKQSQRRYFNVISCNTS